MSSKKGAKQPVDTKDVFATFIAQASAIGNEVDARRRFDEDVTAFLKDRDLVGDFEAFRAARKG